MKHDNMVEMKLSKSERTHAMPDSVGDDPYPYGLSIRLENSELEKLGMDLPSVGEMFEVEAYVKVTNTNESASEGNKGDKSVTLQITKMSIERESKA